MYLLQYLHSFALELMKLKGRWFRVHLHCQVCLGGIPRLHYSKSAELETQLKAYNIFTSLIRCTSEMR